MSSATSGLEARVGIGSRAWSADRTIAEWLQLIQAEYREMPGLALTRAQMKRLWGLDGERSELLLDALVDVGFLRASGQGTYVRADVA